MDTSHVNFLRSLRNEASRQSDFFECRQREVAELWKELETLAHIALTTKQPLHIVLLELKGTTTLIKPGE
jgi:hypothetical protein